MAGRWEKPWNKEAQIIYENIQRIEHVVEVLEAANDELSDIEAESGKAEDAKMLDSIQTDLANLIEDLDDLIYSRSEEFEMYNKPSMEKENIFDVLEEERY